MDNTIAQMTKDELKELIETSVEQKLLEILGDPDEGLEIRGAVRDRLLRQKKAVDAGERGERFEAGKFTGDGSQLNCANSNKELSHD